ncbi:hypothetical protein G3N95_30155 [Paraburkholderia sp. Tr-20389]|nr:hypothetical protein [Paraburkholderia sp. Tr-20389]
MCDLRHDSFCMRRGWRLNRTTPSCFCPTGFYGSRHSQCGDDIGARRFDDGWL